MAMLYFIILCCLKVRFELILALLFGNFFIGSLKDMAYNVIFHSFLSL